MHIAGAGNTSQERALTIGWIPYSGLNYLVLEDDATIDVTGSDAYWMGNLGTAAIRVYNDGKGLLDLGSHTLTRYAEGIETYFLGCDVIGTGSIVFKEKVVVLRENSSLGTDDDMGPVVMDQASATILYLRNTPLVQTRPLQLNVSTRVLCDGNASNVDLFTPLKNAWNGDVTLNGAGVTLTSAPDRGCNSMFTIGGVLSGAGTLQVGTGEAKGVTYLRNRNTYTGETKVTGAGPIGLRLDYPDSVYDISKLTVSHGYVAAVLGKDTDGVTDRWAASDYWNYMTTPTYSNDGHFSLDASELDGQTATVEVADLAAAIPDVDQRALGAAGGTVALHVPAGSEGTLRLASDRGRLALTGGGTFYLAPTNVIRGTVDLGNVDGTPLAEVLVTDGSKVVQGNETVHVGGTDSWTYNPGYARLVVSNASWETTSTANYSSGGEKELGEGAIWLGHQNVGMLDIRDGGSVSNRVVGAAAPPSRKVRAPAPFTWSAADGSTSSARAQCTCLPPSASTTTGTCSRTGERSRRTA